MPKISTPRSPVAVRPGGGNVIRPMYGVFIRDNLAKFRMDISSTLDSTKKAIAKGQPNAKVVAGDGVLQGAELTKAKAAVKDLEKALKAIKGGGIGIGPAPGKPASPPATGGIGVIRPMYGMAFRDDLSKFRDGINGAIDAIRGGMSTLQPNEKAEAKKALTALQAALKDLGAAGRVWN